MKNIKNKAFEGIFQQHKGFKMSKIKNRREKINRFSIFHKFKKHDIFERKKKIGFFFCKIVF